MVRDAGAGRTGLSLPRLVWREKWLLSAAFLLLWKYRIAISLKRFGDPRPRCVGPAEGPPVPLPLARRVAWSVDRAAGLVLAPTCLVRAAAGQRLLAWKGYASQIHIGVRREKARGLAAHAWLVSGDATVLGGGEAERYTPFLGTRE